MIRNYNLLRSVLSEPWYLPLQEAEKFGAILTGLFSPHMEIDPMTKEETAATSYVQSVQLGESKHIHDIGVIRITGALTKYDSWCAYGMESYRQMIRDFKNDDTVSGIVLWIDSPGGTVVGTEELGEEIRTSEKPIVAFVSDMAFSAAYWLAACCREIIANNTTAQVGSIGVLCTYMDLTEYYKKEGIQIHEIIPDQSRDKREEEALIRAGKYDLTKERLGVLAEKFQGVVRAGRPGASDDQLTGRTYYAQDVIGSLVDSIGTFDEAVARAAELVIQTDSNPHNNDKSMKKTPFSNLAKAAGVDSLESADGSIHLTAEMAAAVEKALEEKADPPMEDPDEDPDDEQAPDETEKTETEKTAREKSLEAENTALKEAIQAQALQITELSKQPGATGAAVSPETDATTANDTPAGTFAEAMAEAMDIAKTLKRE